MNEESFKKEILDFEDKYFSPYAAKNCDDFTLLEALIQETGIIYYTAVHFVDI